jgi:hypothetical protein
MFRVIFALIVVTYLVPALLFIKYDKVSIGVWLAGIVATVIALLVNIPLISFFIKLKLFKLWHSLLAGAIIGTVLSLVIYKSMLDQNIIFLAIIGSMHTCIFWLLAFWKNPSFNPPEV